MARAQTTQPTPPARPLGEWSSGPREPRLQPGAVHVWRAELTSAGAELERLLLPAELERAQTILDAGSRARWVCSRGLLRILLGRYLGEGPRALRFGSGAHGKPHLLEGSGEVAFNLAHSGPVGLFAFSGSGAVGVDVELAREDRDLARLAERALGAEEARRIAAVDPNERQREFLRSWTRHEAALKCLGVGIGGASAAAPNTPPCVIDLELGPGRAGAVATERPPAQVFCWEWAGERPAASS
jgi:4'-phosphopantetheinyl transferase